MAHPNDNWIIQELRAPEGSGILERLGNILLCDGREVGRIVNGVPSFLPQNALTPHQESELHHHKVGIKNIRAGKEPLCSPEHPHRAPKNCWEWVTPWLPDTVPATSKIICIGGAFQDDVPHVHSDFKYNIDHLAHESVLLVPEVLSSDSKFIAARAEQLPFANDYADFVYSRNSIDHLCNPLAAILEIYRVLKPGGLLCVGVYFNSTFIDERESTVVDDEFVARALRPLFKIKTLQVTTLRPGRQQATVGGLRTGWLLFVGEKIPDRSFDFTPHEVAQTEKMLEAFHLGLHYSTVNPTLSIPAFTRVLAFEPVFMTDYWRQFYAYLQLFAGLKAEYHRDLRNFLSESGFESIWLETFDQAVDNYKSMRVERIDGSPDESSNSANPWDFFAIPRFVDRERVLVLLARAAASGKNEVQLFQKLQRLMVGGRG